MPIKIVFCYAREDEILLKELQKHLRPLEREKLVEFWYDRDIDPGTPFDQVIKEHLNAAQIVLLLVSPDFIDSDYCYNTEMRLALERHERGEAKVIPIILRHSSWQLVKPLSRLQVLPKDRKPVKDWHDMDRPFNEVAEEIYKVVAALAAKHSSALIIDKVERLAKRKTRSALRNETIYTNTIKDDILHVVRLFETKGQMPNFRDIYRYLVGREKGKLQTAVDDMVLAGSLSKYKSGKTFRYTTSKET